MKDFNLEEAKAGKPVCTRDNRSVRLLCFDAKSPYPIIGLVSSKKGVEVVTDWDEDGMWQDYKHDLDLMMASKKHEGWINIYNDDIYNDRHEYVFGTIYETKELAIERKAGGTPVATIHIEWEE